MEYAIPSWRPQFRSTLLQIPNVESKICRCCKHANRDHGPVHSIVWHGSLQYNCQRCDSCLPLQRVAFRFVVPWPVINRINGSWRIVDEPIWERFPAKWGVYLKRQVLVENGRSIAIN